MVDSTDEQLIHLLQDDAHRSSEALAKQLKVSSATVRRRIEKLIHSGILRIAAIVDPSKVALPLTALIALNVMHKNLDPVMAEIAGRKEIKWVSTATGRFDILALALFHSTEELSDFMRKEITQIEGITETETFICLHVEKGRFLQI